MSNPYGVDGWGEDGKLYERRDVRICTDDCKAHHAHFKAEYREYPVIAHPPKHEWPDDPFEWLTDGRFDKLKEG